MRNERRKTKSEKQKRIFKELLNFSLFIFSFSLPLYAGSYLGAREWGEEPLAANARSSAMGGVAVAGLGEPSDLRVNPAALGLIPDFQASFTWALENHSQEEFLADEPIRRNSFTHFPMGETSLAMPVMTLPLHVGLSFGPWSDLTWEGSHSTQTFQSHGTIWSLVPAVSWKAFDQGEGAFSVGLSLPLFFGHQEKTFASVTDSRDFSGFGQNLGLLAELGRWRLGAQAQFPWKLDPWHFPLAYSVGLAYEGQDPLKTTLMLEARHHSISRSVTEFRIGAEHFFKEKIPFRYGAAFVPFYGQRAISSTLITAGSGLQVRSWGYLDFSLEWGFRDYFGDGLLYPSTERIRENFRRLLISLKYS